MPIKSKYSYPVSRAVGEACGRDSEMYRMCYAMEQWSRKHGYTYRRNRRYRKKRKPGQEEIEFSAS